MVATCSFLGRGLMVVLFVFTAVAEHRAADIFDRLAAESTAEGSPKNNPTNEQGFWSKDPIVDRQVARGERSERISVFCVLSGDVKPFNGDWLIQYAKRLLEELQSICDAIPHLKPDQREWLIKEQERIQRLNEENAKAHAWGTVCMSTEWRLKTVKERLERIISDLQRVSTSRNRPFITPWVEISINLIDPAFGDDLDALEKNDTAQVPESNGLRLSIGDKPANWELIFPILGRGILEKIALPNVELLELKMEIAADKDQPKRTGSASENEKPAVKKPGN